MSIKSEINRAPGFGSTTHSSSHYISQFLRKQSVKESLLNWKQQQEWFHDYSNRDYEYSLQDLLQCEHHDLKLIEHPPATWTRQSHKHLKTIVSGANGFWSIQIYKNTRNQKYDFTISVLSGNMYRFHPDVIKNDITKKYGALIYSTWREMIINDLHCLERLVEAVRERISFVAHSLVCCQSSARLCRKAGIPVSNETAFLFPSNYS